MQRPPTAVTPVYHAPAADPGEDATSPATVPTVRTRLELPTRTIVKVVLVLAVLWLLSRLWTLLLLLFIAALLAAALEPVVSRLDRRGWPRPLSVALIVVALVGVLGLLGLVVVPPAIREGEQLAQDLPDHVERAQVLLDANPAVLDRLRDAANRGAADPGAIAASALRVGAGLIGAIVNALVLLVLTIYLLLDGRRVVAWVLRYVPADHRIKVRRVLPEISKVVSGYIIGQVITSVLFGVVAFAVLTLVGVPQAVLLALPVAAAVPAIERIWREEPAGDAAPATANA